MHTGGPSENVQKGEPSENVQKVGPVNIKQLGPSENVPTGEPSENVQKGGPRKMFKSVVQVKMLKDVGQCRKQKATSCMLKNRVPASPLMVNRVTQILEQKLK